MQEATTYTRTIDALWSLIEHAQISFVVILGSKSYLFANVFLKNIVMQHKWLLGKKKKNPYKIKPYLDSSQVQEQKKKVTPMSS